MKTIKIGIQIIALAVLSIASSWSTAGLIERIEVTTDDYNIAITFESAFDESAVGLLMGDSDFSWELTVDDFNTGGVFAEQTGPVIERNADVFFVTGFNNFSFVMNDIIIGAPGQMDLFRLSVGQTETGSWSAQADYNGSVSDSFARMAAHVAITYADEPAPPETPVTVSEPGSMALLLLGLTGLGASRRQKKA